jgi:hypothetical protein
LSASTWYANFEGLNFPIKKISSTFSDGGVTLHFYSM